VNPGSRSLGARTVNAVQWRFAGAAAAALSQLGSSIVLARLLAPEDFGVMALTWIVIGLLRPLSDLGLGNAVVQRATLSERHIRVAFTLACLLGLGLAVVVYAAAPVCATLLQNPQVTGILRLLALGFAVQGTAVVSSALLRRQLDFRVLFFIDVGSYIGGFAVVAIVLALSGFGVWSLAAGTLVQIVVAAVAQSLFVRHSARPLLATTELSELLNFGIGGTAVALVNYVALNGDNFIVGRWGGAGPLGLYTRAYNLMNLPFSHVSNVISTVLFPALAQVQHEPERLQRAYLLLTQLVGTVAGPVMVAMAVAAPHLIPMLYGPQWLGAIPALQVLCCAGYFRALYHIGGVLAQSAGYVYAELLRQVVYAMIVVLGAWVGLRYGLTGVATGVGLAILFMYLVTGQLCLRITHTPWKQYLLIQRRPAITAGVTFIFALLARRMLTNANAPDALTAVGVIAFASVPATVATLQTLSSPGFEPLFDRLPAPLRRLSKLLQPAVLIPNIRQRS
jgi:PST family polysaccharide transporter